ncbi:PIN domain-containing protein [Breznakiella homolactica]|uniref:PIN domain-containing protein n=1 Tax=Breznakiella homolactica TaxID=2798577 RepID=A0A7T8B7L7_9SPIR|nr:PIN domain-containing protein [Breznakiella homolactica]QQO07639.1 PIN domain-containing protein [Breznakiella homolactica]
MIILDTSVWIEFLKANTAYFNTISSLLEQREILAVECVFGELLQGVKTEKEQGIILKYWEHLPKIDNADIIIEAGKYSRKNKLLDKGVGLIDAVILVHGIRSASKIWTLDKKLQRILPKDLIYKN